MHEKVKFALSHTNILDKLNQIESEKNKHLGVDIFAHVSGNLFDYFPAKNEGETVSSWFFRKNNQYLEKNGFKVHISVDFDCKESIISAWQLLAELNDLDIDSKIACRIQGSYQSGKHIIIYASDFKWLSLLTKRSQDFLSQEPRIAVPNEFNFKWNGKRTRIFMRYCNFDDFHVYNFKEENFFKNERNSSTALAFLKEEHIPSLKELFSGHFENPNRIIFEMILKEQNFEKTLPPLLNLWANGEFLDLFCYFNIEFLHKFIGIRRYL